MNPLFVITTYQGDIHLTQRLLKQLNLRYPENIKVVIYDGHINEEVEDVTYTIHGESVATSQHGPLWFKRWLSIAFSYCEGKNAESVIIKLDPDVYVARQLKKIPDADIFGSVAHSDLFGKSVQCGVFGLRVSVAQEILASQILDDMSLPNYGYQRFGRFAHLGEEIDLIEIQHEDTYLALCIRSLGFTVENWSEVRCRFRPAYGLKEVGSSAALWHPVL
jgi:hypothetical protein